MPGLKVSDLSPEEKTAFQYLFKKADTEGLGVITGDKAVPFFSHSNLPPFILGEIWQMSDDDNKGFLTEDGFFLASRLIGHAQAGKKPSATISRQHGPIPKFDNITIPGLHRPQSPIPSASTFMTMHSIVPQPTGSALAAQHTGSRQLHLQPQNTGGAAFITPADRAQYSRLFQASGPLMGLLDGDKARDIFIKSKLPVDKLGQIWTLADTRARGSLDQTDFILAMYFIQGLMDGKLTSVPPTLPPGLYEAASGGTSLPHVPHIPTSPTRAASIVPPSPIQPVATGGSVFGGGSAFGGPVQAWGVSAVEKANFDKFFQRLDSLNRGYIEGDVAVPFFRESGLDNNVLAKVWELSSVSKDGALTHEEFAVAMKLITDKLNGKDVPDVLPANLVAPSNRKLTPVLTGPQQDLLSLMDEAPVSAPVTSVGPSSVISAPYLSPQHTSVSTHRSPQPPPVPAHRQAPPPPNMDLFGDSFESKPISNDSAQIGNLQNQLQSTQKSVERIQSERGTEDPKIMSNEGQIADLTNKLKTAKEQFEVESKRLEETKKRVASQVDEINKLRSELISAESALSAAKLERNELEQALMRDKEEIRLMKGRMAEATEETKKIKDSLEKVTKEARLQKGLVAITKKQLDTSESEKEKVKEELATAESELEAAKKAVEGSTHSAAMDKSDSVSPTALPLPASNPTSTISSPSLSHSTNPFERMGAFSPAPRTASPLAEPLKEPSSSFASAFAIPSEASPPLPASVMASANSYPDSKNDDEDPFGADEPASVAIPTSFDDAFGVTGVAKESKDERRDFDAAFDDAFSAAPVVAIEPTAKEVTASSFTNAFPEISDPSTQTKSIAPTFDDAFGSSASFKDIQKAKDLESDDGELRPIQDVEPDESDSSDDEEPEQATHSGLAVDVETQPPPLPPVSGAVPTTTTSSASFAPAPISAPNVVPASTPSSVPAPASVSSLTPAQTVVTTASPETGFDDFDAAFADFPPVTAPLATEETKRTEDKKIEDDDWEASFKDFDSVPGVNQTSSSDPFGASFDDAFGKPASASNNLHSSATTSGSGFTTSGFDDAFFTSPNYIPSAPPPKEPPPDTFDPNAAQPDDAEAVKNIVSMGFTRQQALDALEKYNYNTQRAINSLLG